MTSKGKSYSWDNEENQRASLNVRGILSSASVCYSSYMYTLAHAHMCVCARAHVGVQVREQFQVSFFFCHFSGINHFFLVGQGEHMVS